MKCVNQCRGVNKNYFGSVTNTHALQTMKKQPSKLIHYFNFKKTQLVAGMLTAHGSTTNKSMF